MISTYRLQVAVARYVRGDTRTVREIELAWSRLVEALRKEMRAQHEVLDADGGDFLHAQMLPGLTTLLARIRPLRQDADEDVLKDVMRARRAAINIAHRELGEATRAKHLSLGIERYVWISSRDQRVRRRHRELDKTVHRWDDPPVSNPDTGRRAHPGEDWGCLPGDAEVRFASAVSRGFRRWYTGKLTKIISDSGKTACSTPNHPVLTQAGWKPAERVNVGDYVFEIQQQVGDGSEGEVENRVSCADAFEALIKAGCHTSRVVGVVSQFHGDGSDQHVDVVDVRNLRLGRDAKTSQLQGLPQFNFSCTYADGGVVVQASGERGLPQLLIGFFTPLRRSVCRLRKAFSSRTIQASPTLQVGIGAVSESHAGLSHPKGEASSGDPMTPSDSIEGVTRYVLRNGLHIVARRVVSVESRSFSGFVYNFSTHTEWYTTNGLVVHNCRCTASPVIEDVQALPGPALTPRRARAHAPRRVSPAAAVAEVRRVPRLPEPAHAPRRVSPAAAAAEVRRVPKLPEPAQTTRLERAQREPGLLQRLLFGGGISRLRKWLGLT